MHQTKINLDICWYRVQLQPVSLYMHYLPFKIIEIIMLENNPKTKTNNNLMIIVYTKFDVKVDLFSSLCIVMLIRKYGFWKILNLRSTCTRWSVTLLYLMTFVRYYQLSSSFHYEYLMNKQITNCIDNA